MRKNTYIIGEIGQNHNGSIEIAKALIDIASIPVVDELFDHTLSPLDAIKLTKRDLDQEISETQKLKPYSGSNSFGKTYGEHREYLELSDDEHYELYEYTKSKNLEFIETLCGIGCLSIMKYFEPDKLKVASRDLTNIPLLEALAETKIHLILSTGMADQKDLDDALNVITKYHNKISILHCLSQYPAEYRNINLNTIPYLKTKYPKYQIGYSDHSIGISIPLAAVAMGAEIIEKHITLDRRMRGSDHIGSLGIDGLNRLIRDIRNLELSFGEKMIFVSETTKDARTRLERSIATKREIKKGEIIMSDDIHLLSPGDGFKWVEKDKVLNKRVINNVPKNEIIYPEDIE